MVSKLARTGCLLVALSTLSFAPRARAIPAFARKYGTSCLTCHTVFPKLTPFGEAFRRNGYRFPGVDSDYVKQETVTLGQEANKKTFPNSVWPGTLPITSTAGRAAQPGTVLVLQDLVNEGHLWAGGAVDDTITYWGEVTFANDGTVSLEHFQMLFGDLVGPKHAVNLIVGRGFPNVTPFGPHSSFIADQMMPNAPVGALLGNGSGFQLVDNYNGAELNGVIAGRFDYALGLNSGASAVSFRTPTEDFYGHVVVKLGGMRMDGEGSTGAADPLHPWAETALTVYGFGYRSNTFLKADAPPAPSDTATTWGIGGRAQWGSADLTAGWYHEEHDHGMDDGTAATARVLWGELSYILFPWMVPAIRVEHIALDLTGSPSVDAWHVMPGIAFLIRPNLKVIAVANWEHANGFPSSAANPGTIFSWTGGSADWGAFTISPGPDATAATSSSEFQTFAVFLAWAM
jgi:hypothetical protein